jgi:hypothetical protein
MKTIFLIFQGIAFSTKHLFSTCFFMLQTLLSMFQLIFCVANIIFVFTTGYRGIQWVTFPPDVQTLVWLALEFSIGYLSCHKIRHKFD